MNQEELLASLNPVQRQAVTAPEDSVLILAGAGSGKTRVLTTRIAYLLNQGLAQTSEILAVTFTNKAAKEMLTRLEAMLPYDLRRMWVGTFHGLCNRILRRHAEFAALPKTFQIIDSGDQLSMIKRVMRAMNINTDEHDPKSVANFINWSKEQGLRANQARGDAKNSVFADVYAEYERQCQREGVVDFSELLLRCYELLERNELVRTHYQQRFRHILVDEFQDTNVLQYRWLKLLAGCGLGPGGRSLNAVFAVGDDDQSIYAFRGANVGNMADFISDFHAGQIKLEQNYRSTGTILDAANALISQNNGRLGKNLWTAGAKGDRIVVAELENDQEEARWVTDDIRQERARGSRWQDFAVLYRMNAQSRSLEAALNNAGIPYRIYGGLRFFERMEVKHVLGYMRLLTNPWDDTSFLRVVNFPTRGIGSKTIESLAETASSRGISLWAAMTAPDVKIPPKLAQFRLMIEQMRMALEQSPLKVVISEVIKRSGLRDHFLKEKDADERIANMDEIINAADGYLKSEGIAEGAPAFAPFSDEAPTPIEGFLTQATLEAGDKNEGEGADCVQLMTVHAAKGLEFKYVYLVGCEEGIFPHFSAKEDKSRGGLEEERRLMYVAITRAKRRLIITHCTERVTYGNRFRNPMSSFIEEIPPQLLDVRSLTEKSSGWDDDEDEDGWGGRSGSKGWGGRSSGRSWGAGFDKKPGGYGQSGGGWSGSRGSAYGSKSSGYGKARAAGFGSGGYNAKDPLASVKTATGAAWRTPVVKAASEGSAGFAAGDKVRHKTLGDGTVVAVLGTGPAAQIEIRFGTATKRLLLAIAGPMLAKR